MARSSDPSSRRGTPLLMWSLLAVLGIIVCAVFVIARTLGIRIALEVAAGLVTLYAVMGALLTAAHIAALRDAACGDDDLSEREPR